MLRKSLFPVNLGTVTLFVVSAVVALGTFSSATDSAVVDRALQSSILCLVSGTDFTDCCPSGANPNDGACTLLSCVNFDNVTIRDDCDCLQLEVACGQVAMFADLVANLSEMCIAVDNCCDGADTTKNAITTTTATFNTDFDKCMVSTIEESGLTVPDIGSLLPGGEGNSDVQSANGASAGDGTGAKVTTTTTSTTTSSATLKTSATLPPQKTVELAVNTNDAMMGVARYLEFSVIGVLVVFLL